MSSPRFRNTDTAWLRRSTVAAAALLAIAGTVAGINGRALWQRWLWSDMDAVVAASAPLRYRPSLARLSANFSYRTVAPRNRGDANAAIGDPQYSRLWPIIERLVRAPGSGHALGVSQLLTGNPAEAVNTLEQVLRLETKEQGEIAEAIRRSTNATLLNDLAAAYQTRIEQKGDLTLRPNALEAVERAWSLEKTPPIAWTRAVVIESHHVHEQSIAAWREYLALEPHSDWSEFARERLRELQQPTDAELWLSVRRQLAASGNDEGALFPSVDRFRQEVRLWCEDELLPQWGEATLRGDASAPARLAKVAALGRALERANGEHDVTEAVEAIRKSTSATLQQLARGHVAYGAGRTAQLHADAAGALRSMETAMGAFGPQSTPFAWLPRIEHAAALYSNNDYTRARAELEQVPEALLSKSCRARTDALLGIVVLHTGAYEKAAEHYVRAIEAYRAIGERDYEATLLSRLASALEFAGDADGARARREQALQLLDRIGNRAHRHDVMIDAALVAVGNGQHAVAGLYFDTLVANNVAAKDYDAACASFTWRSAYYYRRNLLQAAAADLDEAKRVCASIPDRAVRERDLANLEVARLTVGADADGDAAIDYYKRTNSHVWLRSAYLARARRFARRGDAAAAERDFRAALAESDASRETIDDRGVRLEFTATADEITDGYVEFLLSQHREQDAFETADRSRLRELVDSPTARWRGGSAAPLLPRVQASLPFGTTLIEYRVLGDRLVAWVIGTDAFHTIAFPASLRDVKLALAQIDANVDEPVLRTHAALLYDALMRPIERFLNDSTALVIIPDDELERVPYPALYDRLHGHYLVKSRATDIAPSAALFLESAARSRERARGNEMIVVRAAAAGKTAAALPEGDAETRALARLYPNSRVVDGTEGTGQALLSRARQAALLQFVGHTRMDRDGSSLALRLGDGPRAQVTMADILAVPLPRLRLAYLSACQTDSGPILKSEGSVTIARSFFAAGVPVVVGTLWAVDDASARMASLEFHRHLRSGDTPAESLRQAQLALLSHDGKSRIDWAAFRVIGAGL